MATYDYSDKPLATPATGPRPDAGPMRTSELQSLVGGLITSAIQYVDGELSPERAKATDYYFGRPFGNEEPGRSQVVLTEVRDGVSAVIPPMLRIVFGPERAVEFRPDRRETVAVAEQATDYVNYVFAEDNPGFLLTHAVLKDGLVRKLGVFKWVWDEYSTVTNHKVEGVTQEQLELLAQDEEIELTRVEDGTPIPPDASGNPTLTYHVELKRTVKDGKACVYAVPPEEFLFNREARDLESALFVAHRTRKTRGELIAMGIEPRVLDEHGGDDAALEGNEEVLSRAPTESGYYEDDPAGEANGKVLYVEAYARIDYDGDGIAELRRICTIGSGHHVVMNDPWDEVPFAVFCPDPEPHTILGQSWADRLMDMQRVKSALMRAGLDSLAASIHPRTWYVEGQVNLSDVLNTAIGAPIRVRQPGAVGEFAHTFTGREAFPVLQYCDEVVERRTGQSKGAQGLDADALQSSTRAAVAAAVSASQAQQEMLVRIFAEGTLKPLFRGLNRLLIKHQPRARMIKLRNQWVEVDPRSWNADMDVQVNVALGSGLVEEKVATLMEVVGKQAEVLQALGPQNPLVGLKEYRDTLAQIVELRGFKNSDRYFKPVTQEQLDQLAAQEAQQPPQETPEMVLARAQIEIEQLKAQTKKEADLMQAQTELLKVRAELELKRREMLLEDDRQRDKIAADTITKLREIEAKTGVPQADAIAAIQAMRAQAIRGPEQLAPKRKRFVAERDGHGRLVGGTIVEEEDVA